MDFFFRSGQVCFHSCHAGGHGLHKIRIFPAKGHRNAQKHQLITSIWSFLYSHRIRPPYCVSMQAKGGVLLRLAPCNLYLLWITCNIGYASFLSRSFESGQTLVNLHQRTPTSLSPYQCVSQSRRCSLAPTSLDANAFT